MPLAIVRALQRARGLREERDAQQESAAKRQGKEIARVQKFVDRFRYQANKASQVQSRLKQLDKVKRIELARDVKRVRFKFPVPPASGRPRRAPLAERCEPLSFAWRKRTTALMRSHAVLTRGGRR